MIQQFISNPKNARWITLVVFGIAVFSILWTLCDLYQAIEKLDVIKSTQRFVVGFAASLFVLLWWSGIRKYPDGYHGQLFFALAWLVWSFPSDNDTVTATYFKSGLNNLFLFWVLRDFKYGGFDSHEAFFKKIKLTRNNYLEVLFVVTVFITVFESLLIEYSQEFIGKLIDVFVSSSVLILLGTAISKGFLKRFDKEIAILFCIITWCSILTAILTQVFIAFFKNDPLTPIFSISYQVGITFTVSALAFASAFALLVEALQKESEHHKSVIEYSKERESDMIHIIRNSLSHLQADLKIMENEDHIRVGSVRTLFELIHLDKPSNIFQFLQGASLKNYLNAVLESLKESYRWHELHTDIEYVPVELTVWETSAQKLARIVVEACINAYKYAGEDKQAWVRVIFDGTRIIASVEDRGVGYGNNAPTDKSRGFGEKVIAMYLKDLKGSRKITTLEKGTLVTFFVPFTKFNKNENPTA